MINVKTDEIYGKNPIVSSTDLRRHIINIDSRFRKTYQELPTDFLFDMAHTYKNVIQMSVTSIEVPDVAYRFSKAKKNTMMRIDAADYMGTVHHLHVEIDEGNYTGEQLMQAIQGKLNGFRDMYGIFFRIVMDDRTKRVTIYHDGSAPPPCPAGPSHCPVQFVLMFTMVGLEDRQYDFGLGYNLGFKEKIYMVDAPLIKGESVVTVEGDEYYLLGVDEMYTVEHKTQDTYIQCMAKIVRNTLVTNEFVFPRPTDIRQVRIRVMDRYGIPIDIHYQNVSLSLELTEVMNIQLYDNYRNNVWEMKEPRAKEKLSGSALPIGVGGRSFN